jgi:hypothetical protein
MHVLDSISSLFYPAFCRFQRNIGQYLLHFETPLLYDGHMLYQGSKWPVYTAKSLQHTNFVRKRDGECIILTRITTALQLNLDC